MLVDRCGYLAGGVGSVRRRRLDRTDNPTASPVDGRRLSLIASSPFGLLVLGVLLATTRSGDVFDPRVMSSLWAGAVMFLVCACYAGIRPRINDIEWFVYTSFILALLAVIATNAREAVLAEQLASTLMFPPLMIAAFIPPKPTAVFGTVSITLVWLVSVRAEELPQQRLYGAFLISVSIIVATGFVSVMRWALDAERRRAESLSTLDQLTGLQNRRGMATRYAAMMARAQRDQRIFALLIADIDHFKKINDNLGHKAGDHVLQGIAQQIRGVIRPDDLAIRLGGEEFAILSSVKNPQDVSVLAERLRQHIAEYSVGVPAWRVTVSIGVAYASLVLGTTSEAVFDHLMNSADSLLYDAKKAGRDCVRIAELDSWVFS